MTTAKQTISIAAMCIMMLFTINQTSHAEEQATPEEIIAKVQEAADLIEQKKEAVIDDFSVKDSKWVFKDTYIFVYNCSKGEIVGHPIKPQLIGKKLMGLKDTKGNAFFVQLCENSKKPKGGWTEYWWPKPGEDTSSRKVSLMLQVPGTEYQVGAGIYNDNISVDELNKLL